MSAHFLAHGWHACRGLWSSLSMLLCWRSKVVAPACTLFHRRVPQGVPAIVVPDMIKAAHRLASQGRLQEFLFPCGRRSRDESAPVIPRFPDAFEFRPDCGGTVGDTKPRSNTDELHPIHVNVQPSQFSWPQKIRRDGVVRPCRESLQVCRAGPSNQCSWVHSRRIF